MNPSFSPAPDSQSPDASSTNTENVSSTPQTTSTNAPIVSSTPHADETRESLAPLGNDVVSRPQAHWNEPIAPEPARATAAT
jgi:hypothetical protein